MRLARLWTHIVRRINSKEVKRRYGTKMRGCEVWVAKFGMFLFRQTKVEN